MSANVTSLGGAIDRIVAGLNGLGDCIHAFSSGDFGVEAIQTIVAPDRQLLHRRDV